MREMNETNKPRPVSHRKPRVNPYLVNVTVRYILRTLMVLFTTVLLVFMAACLLLNSIFNGPSVAARDVLTRSLSYSSGTWWIPSLFLGEELASQIITNKDNLDSIGDKNTIEIDTSGSMNSNSDEWKDHPDGIYIERVKGATYTAHVMIVRDPSTVYLATSTDKFDKNTPGGRLNQIMESENAIAGINGGAFYDNGTSSLVVGSVPEGLVVSKGEIMWSDGRSGPSSGLFTGFVGFNEDNMLIVSKTITAAKAKEWNIRDGCCFGPVLIMDGIINEQAKENDAGWNPRTAIGQRADGAVIMVCIDGRQLGSAGGSFADVIDIMVEYGAVNACSLDGGSSTIMYYRDTYGLYGEAGKLQAINTYSSLQADPRRMPTFFLVAPSSED